MPRRKSRPRRKRVGRVSYYQHHGGWYVYYLEGRQRIRRRVAADEQTAEQAAAQINARLTSAEPTPFAFTPVTVRELRRRFLEHHEQVRGSSLATINRYRTATQHLQNFCCGDLPAHEIRVEDFVRYLRNLRVAPNGHPNTAKRPLRGKGIRFVLEASRSLYAYAKRQRHLPPYHENPFTSIGLQRLKLEAPKPAFVFDAASELQFLQACDDWSFPVHFTLATTGMRPGELIHLLIEDLDLAGGWLNVRNKSELGWQIKTGRERAIPLVHELVIVLQHVIGTRTAGPVFLRHKFRSAAPLLGYIGSAELQDVLQSKLAAAAESSEKPLTRAAQARVARSVWRDAGAIRAERLRQSFIRTARDIGLTSTCPKSWRHTFATLLQDANVDPLIRQITLGHQPANAARGGLGMTSVYTHTRPETQQREISRALRLWPEPLELGRAWTINRSSEVYTSQDTS